MPFVNLKDYEPIIGTVLACDLYIKTSEQKVLLLFKTGSILNAEDIVRCKKYSQMNCMYAKEEDYLSLFKKETDDLKSSLDAGGEIDIKAGFKLSKTFFKSEALLSSDNKLDSMMSVANQFVTDLLKSSKDHRSQALVDIMKELSSSEDVFINHINQVSAISTMIALMTENVTLENIIEINLVSILHGMGLMLVSNQQNAFFSNYADIANFKEAIGKTDQAIIKKILDKHFDGHNKLTTSDNVIFLQHLTLIEQNIDKIKIKNIKSQAILKTVSDFKMILGSTESTALKSNPYISAKILVIGDRLVSLMNYYKKNDSFITSAIRALEELNKSPKPMFDIKIIEKVSQMA